ncbi:MAG: hypothetical protein ACKO9Q_13880, partial [Pirellula sp.]
MNSHPSKANTRRFFLKSSALSGAAIASAGHLQSAKAQDQPQAQSPKLITPPEKRILLSCKLSMIKGDIDGKPLKLAQRLGLAKEAGFD